MRNDINFNDTPGAILAKTTQGTSVTELATTILDNKVLEWFLSKSLKSGLANSGSLRAEEESELASKIEADVQILWKDEDTRNTIKAMYTEQKPQADKASLEELRRRYGVVRER